MSQRLPDYSVTGEGEVTVFLLHGAFGAKEYWRTQLHALSRAGYRVVAWDAPGYGASPLPDDFSVETAAQACARLVDAQGGRTNVILGHSMGGMIAQRTFDYRKGRVHGLILSSTSAAFGKSDGEWQREFVRARVAPLDRGLSIPEYAPEMLKGMMAPDTAGAEVDLLVQVVSGMREETFRAAIQAITKFDGRDALPAIAKVPVLCVAGELDANAAPPEVMEKLASRIDGEFVCMQGVGHFGWAERPGEYNEIVLDFLNRHFPPG